MAGHHRSLAADVEIAGAIGRQRMKSGVANGHIIEDGGPATSAGKLLSDDAMRGSAAVLAMARDVDVAEFIDDHRLWGGVLPCDVLEGIDGQGVRGNRFSAAVDFRRSSRNCNRTRSASALFPIPV